MSYVSCPSNCDGCPCIHCKFYRETEHLPIEPAKVRTWYVYYSDGSTPYNDCIAVEASSAEMAELIAKIDPEMLGRPYYRNSSATYYDVLVELFVRDHYDVEYCMP